MMTRQDGAPIIGPCTFPCPHSAVIVSWKPSVCSESCAGVLRQPMTAEKIRDGEDDVSICGVGAHELWHMTHFRKSSSYAGGQRDSLRNGGNG